MRLEYLSKSLKLSKTDEVINGWWKILLEKNTISLYKTLAVSNPFNTYKNEYIQSSLLDSLKKQALINIDIIEYNVALNDVSIPTLEDFVENKTENMYWDEVDLELKRLLQADKNAFKQAKNTHSREAYLNYIQKNPYGKYVNEAKNLRDGISVISNIVGIRSSFNGKPTIRIYFDVKLDNEETTRVKINKIYNSQGIPMRKVNWADRYKVFQPIKKSGNYFITWFVLEDTDVLEGEITFKLDATVKEIFQAGTFTHEKTGKEYRTVEIGEDVWMAEDLNAVQNWGNTKDYYHSSDNKGRLYNLSAARTVAIEIPGWHLPTEEEWERLDKFFDKNSNNVERDLYRYFISNHVGCYTKTKFKAVNEGYGVRHKTGYYLESAEASFREVDETSYFWLDYDEYRVEKDEAGIKRGKVGYIRKHKSIISDTRNATSNCYSVRLVKDK